MNIYVYIFYILRTRKTSLCRMISLLNERLLLGLLYPGPEVNGHQEIVYFSVLALEFRDETSDNY